MKNSQLIWFIALSLLLMGIEGATDFAQASPFHPDTSIEHVDHHSSNATQADNDGGDHCNHCCHAHVGTLCHASSNDGLLNSESGFFTKAQFPLERTQGPPTPPPNA